MPDWLSVVWLLMALVLVAPAAYRIVTGNPQLALKSVVGWLGIAVLAAFLYNNTGIGEWWANKHGGYRSTPAEEEQPIDPNDEQAY